ncbi:CBS domain-containing protein [Anaerolinea sp.]|uniref:CBS domain-containing protein n=1 Tax=Anaerolinea sp. TaxID=1872519 RepID=UPI002ACD9DA8|nr:CBS domain-containing protein [Anaerolinea sp.]
MYSRVEDILREKGTQVWSVSPEDTLLTTLLRLAEKKIGALLVMEGERIAGIVSERDIVREIAHHRACALDAPIKAFMTEEVITVTPQTTVEECMQLMTRAHIRHLPVVQEGKLVGIISIGDVVKKVIEGQAIMIDDLEGYITGDKFGR